MKSPMHSQTLTFTSAVIRKENLLFCTGPSDQNIYEDLLLCGSSCAETFYCMLRGTFRDDHVKNTYSAVAPAQKHFIVCCAEPTAQIILKNFCCAGATWRRSFSLYASRESTANQGISPAQNLYLQSTVVLLNSVMTRLSYIMQRSDCWCTLRQRQNDILQSLC